MAIRVKIFLAVVLFLIVLPFSALAQTISVSGKVTERIGGAPVEFATIVLEGSSQWAVADAKGNFSIANVQPGKTVISISCLGYVTKTLEISLSKDAKMQFALDADNLSLAGAVVTAREDGSAATTSRTIDKTALDHVQVMNVSDISSLLPGGATVSPNLTDDQSFNLRATTGERGSASFGTAVEVDGVRLSSNASFAGASTLTTSLKGASTNSIASANVESVEVITGVPSVEYGDMTSGVVKINTKKGKMPYSLTMSTSPNTKQFSLSKGFGLGSTASGASLGVLNASAEYTKSVSDKMSPYTSYDRKQVSLTYSNLFSEGALSTTPIRMSMGVAGNLGGLDDSSDPDLLIGTYTKTRDNSLRANLNADWLLSKSWITNIELNASIVYGDKLSRKNDAYSSPTTTSVLHRTEEGYYMADKIPSGYWSNVMVTDDKPLTAKVTLKANWAHNFGQVNNKLKIGADWSADKNYGRGQYSEDETTAPTYREYRYRDVPLMSNIAVYVEDNLMIPVGNDGRINLIAGLRSDNTVINGSQYGVTSSLSPRFNLKYTVFTEKFRRNEFLRSLAFRASWGVAVKQPSYAILYPQPTYFDINVFTSTASADNVLYRGYYVIPHTIEYNSALRWQKNHQSEVGVEVNLGGTKISLAGFYNKTLDSYLISSSYDRLSYNYTSPSAVQGSAIPSNDRVYTIDRTTGVVTVSDKTGSLASYEAPYITRKQFVSGFYADNNSSPITRYGLEWVIDFNRIEPLNTTIRLDGNFYSYRTVDTGIRASSPYTTSGYDGTPYRYIGYYIGDNGISNGSETRKLKTNVTVTTQIPKVRMIFSLKLEGTLLNYSQALSEGAEGALRSHVLSDKADILSTTDGSVYDGDNYSVVYPEYYVSFDDPEPKNYLEMLKWARANNDTELYSDLSKLAVSSSTLKYYFNKDYITPYFCANFSVTKEIGDLASLSFYANNFFNNLSQVYSTRTGKYSSVSGYISKFYYGMTIRLKF